MKYLEIKLEDNKSILVDESVDIQDWYYLPKENRIAKKFASICLKGVTPKWTIAIIATINHSIDKDVPMIIVKDDTTWSKSCEITNLQIKERVNPHAYRLCWLDNKAQQKGVYLLDQIMAAIDKAKVRDFINENLRPDKYTASEIIKSKQEYVELEMEETPVMNDRTLSHVESKAISLIKNTTFPKLKTTRNESGQLIAYIKK